MVDNITCASLPSEALPLLAPLRCEPGLQVAVAAGRLWLRFEPGNERILRGVLPLHGVVLFACRDGTWRRFNQSLPAFDFPTDPHFEPLYQVLFPAPVLPLALGDSAVVSCPLEMKPDGRPRPTTAMLCSTAVLAAWADSAPAAQIERLHGARHEKRILVLGDRLPMLDGGERFWGKLVLAPLGFCPDPDLPEAALREAAGAAADELLMFRRVGVEAIPRTAFERLSRVRLRLAAEEAS
jgi:hypothetical protein